MHFVAIASALDILDMSDIKNNLIAIKETLPPDVCLVAVSKFHPLPDLLEAYSAGQRIFGESRPQELHSKVVQLSSMGLADQVVWHFIGHLQTNKLKLVLPYVSLVESVDSVSLLDAIEAWAAANPNPDSSLNPSLADCTQCGAAAFGDPIHQDGTQRTVHVLIELHISSEPTKSGFTPEDAYALLTGENRWPHVRFCGLMGMATFTNDKSVIESDFKKLTSLFEKLRPSVGKCPCLTDEFREMSFGMSEDYKIAVEMGATIVRIGTSIFGPRCY